MLSPSQTESRCWLLGAYASTTFCVKSKQQVRTHIRNGIDPAESCECGWVLIDYLGTPGE